MKILYKLLYGNNPDVTPILTIASTNGIAPFGVVIEGTLTTATGNIRPLRDLLYFFECTDPGMGVYDHGQLVGKPRNKFLGGPVHAFTLVTPGTHIIRMWVYDGVTLYGPVSQSITVQDPDIVFGGSLTTVVSTSGNFTGAPSGANFVTSNDFDTQITSESVSGSGKRVLFRVGETFQSSTAGIFKNRINYHIGTFGTGADYANVQVVSNMVGPVFGGNPLNASENNDYISVSGLHFTRVLGGGVTGGIALGTGTKPETVGGIDYIKGNFTFHRCKSSNIWGLGVAVGGYNTVFSQCIAENINEGIAQSGGIGVYIDETIRSAVLDSLVDCNNGGEHCIRRQGGNYFTAVSNTLRRPAVSKSFITVRGWQNRTAETQITSRYNQVSYNYIDGSTNGAVNSFLSIDIAPQNISAFEPIADSIIESNYIYAHNISYSSCSRIQAVGCTYRNNAHYLGTQITNSFYGVQISGASTNTIGSSDCEFIGNSFSVASNATGFSAFWKHASSGADNRVYNNIAYAPNQIRDGSGSGSTPTLFLDQSGTIIALNNSSDVHVKSTDPIFVGATTTMSGFKLQSNSPYNNFGSNYKNWVDGFGYLRSFVVPDAGSMNSVVNQIDAWSLIS